MSFDFRSPQRCACVCLAHFHCDLGKCSDWSLEWRSCNSFLPSHIQEVQTDQKILVSSERDSVNCQLDRLLPEKFQSPKSEMQRKNYAASVPFSRAEQKC